MSFTDVENLFHCFGCKMGGDIYKYVQEINNLEFQDAVELVAEKYGFKLTYTETSQNNNIFSNGSLPGLEGLLKVCFCHLAIRGYAS